MKRKQKKIKIRKSWGDFSPASRPHNPKRGVYDRRETRQLERQAKLFEKKS